MWFTSWICSGSVIGCTLWDNYATKFLSHWNEKQNSDTTIVILTQAKIKAPLGNSMFHSLIYEQCFNYLNNYWIITYV